jgi:hypothetical protein
MKSKSAFCLIFVFILVYAYPALSTDINGFLQNATSFQYNCETGAPDQCPEYLSERLYNFTGHRMLQSDPYERCMRRDEFNQGNVFDNLIPGLVDSSFHDNDLLHNGGQTRDFGEGCIKRYGNDQEGFDFVESKVIELVERCETGNPSFTPSCLQNVPILRKSYNTQTIAVADNYLSHLKLRTGIEESLRSVSLIDMMYGENVLENQDCSEMPYPQSYQVCVNKKLNTCQETAFATQMKSDQLDLTKNTLKKLRELKFNGRLIKREINDTSHFNNSSEELQKINDLFKQLDALDEQEALYTAQAPWIEAPEFKKYRNRINESFDAENEVEFNRLTDEALKLQMLANRDVINTQVNEYKVAALCLRGVGRCKRNDTDSIIRKAPRINLENLDIPHKNTLDFAQCLEDEAINVNFNENLITEIAIGAGLTIASIVIPPLGIARVAQLGGRVVTGATRVAKLRAASAVAASAGVFTGDLYYASESFQDAINQCSITSESSIEFDDSVIPTSSVNCARENHGLRARAQNLPTSCVSSVLFASLDAIPFASFVSSSALTAARTLRVSRSAAAVGTGRMRTFGRLEFEARTTTHPTSNAALDSANFKESVTPFDGYQELALGVKERRDVKLRLISHYEEVGNMEAANRVRNMLSQRDVPNIYIHYDLENPDFPDDIYIAMVRSGNPDLPVPGAGNYLLRRVARENPGKTFVSTIAYDNASQFKNSFRELAELGMENVSPEQLTAALMRIPISKSFPGTIRFEPKFENGELVDVYVRRLPDLESNKMVIEGVDDLLGNQDFSDWMKSLKERPDTYFDRGNSSFNPN